MIFKAGEKNYKILASKGIKRGNRAAIINKLKLFTTQTYINMPINNR
jgi:hypothetical protein